MKDWLTVHEGSAPLVIGLPHTGTEIPPEIEARMTSPWLARKDADGYLFIVDRAKDMIITGGENVYSKEVEDVISGHPDVVDVAVVGKPNEEWGETVVAHVVWREPDVISADDIKDYLSDKLARYKIPREVVFATILPRTPTGKIQKHLIRAAS